ncbi:hypothetical protein HY489_01425 [Candidatus Woesearchaeota archaeon]|nr:hypothetical protein [Candidatus Woesearchaeota archaeon]
MEFATGIELLKRLEVAFITLFAGLVIGAVVGKVLKRVFFEFEIDRIADGLSSVLAGMVEYLLYAITVLLVLQQFSLTRPVMITVVLFASVFVIYVFLGEFLDVVPNILAGLLVRGRVSSLLGRKVHVGRISGVVKTVGWRGFWLKDKKLFFVPYWHAFRVGVRI